MSGRFSRRWGRSVLPALGLAVAAVAACPWPSAAGSASPQPLPAGAKPSAIAIMPCQPSGQRELTAALGLKGTVVHRSWVHHRYSCTYAYKNGTFTLSIQELSSWPQTFAYYRGLGRTLGKVGPLANLGQGAFQTKNGSVVVRKDWKVLLVDVSKLPPRFGVPPTGSNYIAVTIADVVLGCWAGD